VTRRRHHQRIASGARMHQSFTISGAIGKNGVAESVVAIRAKNRFWRAPISRKAGKRKNFFIAKNRDSESAQPPFSHD
jgi:hypothetical protein